MPEPSIGNVPFQEAIDHFREKLSIPTRSYDAMLGEVHAKAFTVAGAMNVDLLSDIRASVDQAISSGTTITDFRKQFDATVQKHGWSYKGKRGWRTRVIFDNNLRTAHMAGRWQQFQRVKETRPFLQYQTAGDRRVRPEHADWDNQVLHIDDSWWSTHMPPNGWGCRCTVRSLSPRQMRRDKLDVSQAPPLEESDRISSTTGEAFGKVPKGIDTGWNYNVGKAWLGPEIAFGKKAIPLPEGIRSTVIGNTAIFNQVFSKPFKTWAQGVIKSDSNRGQIRAIGYMNHKTISFATAEGLVIDDATITISDDRLRRMLKPKSRRAGKALVPEEELLKLPKHVAKPKAILWDKTEKAVVYVFDIKGQSAGSGKFFVALNFRQRGEISNSIRSAGVSSITNLKDKNHYEVIDGKL